MELIRAAVLGLCMTVAVIGRFRNKPWVLDFLVDGELQELIELLHFLFDLAYVRQFDLDGGAEAVAAVVGQAELFAVVGAEFDGHVRLGWWDVGTKKPDL